MKNVARHLGHIENHNNPEMAIVEKWLSQTRVKPRFCLGLTQNDLKAGSPVAIFFVKHGVRSKHFWGNIYRSAQKIFASLRNIINFNH